MAHAAAAAYAAQSQSLAGWDWTLLPARLQIAAAAATPGGLQDPR